MVIVSNNVLVVELFFLVEVINSLILVISYDVVEVYLFIFVMDIFIEFVERVEISLVVCMEMIMRISIIIMVNVYVGRSFQFSFWRDSLVVVDECFRFVVEVVVEVEFFIVQCILGVVLVDIMISSRVFIVWIIRIYKSMQ